ncbi:hypothetical protein ACT3R7_09425 [Halomonas sp. AOP43-A1-21]|uniref:hypothetical protein n=1 Tax=Halomonas TaxID=2745 RepID=UPI0018677529|nr:hypothetical protein [Halomonas colorata]
MSETASTIIKLLSALTSPKAAVKYLSVSVSIVISWKYFSELAKSLGTPEENISIVVLLAGVGLGSIVGQIIIWLGEMVWSFVSGKLEARKHTQKEIKHKAESDLKTANDNEALLRKYTESFEHLGWESKEKLRELTLRDITLDFSNLAFKALLENKYVKLISQISNRNYLVALNPVIVEVTKATWEQEIKANVDDYFLEMTSEKSKVLELMEFRKADDDSLIDFDISSTIFPYYSCIRREAKDENGFWLCFRSYYLDEFSNRTGKEYQEETWIDKGRILPSAESEAESA